ESAPISGLGFLFGFRVSGFWFRRKKAGKAFNAKIPRLDAHVAARYDKVLHITVRFTMVLTILRALFILLMAAVGWFYVNSPAQPFGGFTWLSLAIALTIGTFLVCIDILAPRKKLVIFSGTFLGL